MENELIRKIYIEYLDNLTFRIRHNRTLNSTEKQILQELIFNESIRISRFNEMKELREVLEKLEKEG